jgi:hypothetical protein
MPAFLICAASPWEGRPGHHQAARRLVLQPDLLGYGKGAVYLDAEMAHPLSSFVCARSSRTALRLPVFLYICAALVGRIECVP